MSLPRVVVRDTLAGVIRSVIIPGARIIPRAVPSGTIYGNMFLGTDSAARLIVAVNYTSPLGVAPPGPRW